MSEGKDKEFSLMQWRNTAFNLKGTTPAEIMFKRNVRTMIPNSKIQTENHYNSKEPMVMKELSKDPLQTLATNILHLCFSIYKFISIYWRLFYYLNNQTSILTFR